MRIAYCIWTFWRGHAIFKVKGRAGLVALDLRYRFVAKYLSDYYEKHHKIFEGNGAGREKLQAL